MNDRDSLGILSCIQFWLIGCTSVWCSIIESFTPCFLLVLPIYNTKKINYKKIFSSPSHCIWGTLVIEQIFDFPFLADLHILGSGKSKKHKISMVSGCSFVSMLISLLDCGDDTTWTNSLKNFVPVLKEHLYCL